MGVLGDFDPDNLLFTAIVTFGIQFTFFMMAVIFRFDKVTDIAYGGNFVVLAIITLVSEGIYSTRIILVTGAVILWGVRLSTYVMVRILKIGEDKRFDDRRNSLKRLVQFWSFQALVIWLVYWPSNYVTRDPRNTLGGLEIVGLVLFVFGLAEETIADQVKYAYRNNPANKGHWCDVGPWKWLSRHPNFHGELTLWWGIFLMVIPSMSGIDFLSALGPLVLSLSILFVSGVPLLEESADKRYWHRPDYQAYRASTSPFFPIPPPIWTRLPAGLKYFLLEIPYYSYPQPPKDDAAPPSEPSSATSGEPAASA